MIRQFRQWRDSKRPDPRAPEGVRLYAVGDLHGEADLFLQLLRRIEEELERDAPEQVRLILLGDLIDRGPRSDILLHSLSQSSHGDVVILKGNHEAALVDGYRGDDHALRFWLEYGGEATLGSFGIEAPPPEDFDPVALRAEMRRTIDSALIDWLDRLPVSHVEGDYFFVHAGIRPGRALDRQSEEDMLWIREPFLSSERHHGKIIVHGHTFDGQDVALGGNRIGLDTGAYEYGHLSALALQDDRQWTLKAVAGEGAGA